MRGVGKAGYGVKRKEIEGCAQSDLQYCPLSSEHCTGATAMEDEPPVITDGPNILLGKGREDGKWTVPGGFVEVGEDADAAGVREAKEETGLTIEIVKPLLLFKGAIEARSKGSSTTILSYNSPRLQVANRAQ